MKLLDIPDAYMFDDGRDFNLNDRLLSLVNVFNKDFYVPKFKGKYPMNLSMVCLGKHWNATDNKYYDTRIDFDNSNVRQIPKDFISYASYFSTKCFPYHNPDWDICVINKYLPGNKLGIHRDNSESEASLNIGHPVVSFSIGASCVFQYGETKNNLSEVILKSGDVLVFGGKSRLMYHGVKSVMSDAPERINITLRKY